MKKTLLILSITLSHLIHTTAPITTFVVPCGGDGTRMLSSSKAVAKEMVNIMNRPAIELIIKEGIDSGLSKFILITKRGKDSIGNHFDAAPDLENLLAKAGKSHLLAEVTEMRSLINIMYIRQPEQKGTGHAILLAKPWITDDYFCVGWPDNLIVGKEHLFAEMIKICQQENACVIAIEEIPVEEIPYNGVVVIGKEIQPNVYEVTNLIEKPKPHETQSNLVNSGRFVLSSKIFQALEEIPYAANGELQLPDAILHMIKKGERVVAYRMKNQRYDIGRPVPWLEATMRYALENPAFKDEVRALMHELVQEYQL